ncbi:unnamed protein product, partial [marine sediment metagenome]
NGLWGSDAIYLSRSDNNEFQNLTVSNNLGPGIRLYGSSNNLLSGSVVENNSGYGVYLYDFSNDNTISNIYIANNSGNGIYLRYWSVNNTFSRNTILANEYGIYLTEDSKGVIYNSTISNSSQGDIFVQTNSELDLINTSFNKSSIDVSGNSVLRVKWFMHAEVKDIASLPVDAAEVIVRNASGEVTGTGLTDADGKVRWIEVTEFVQEDAKRTYHTPHNVTAIKDVSYGAAVPEPNMSMSREVMITQNMTKPNTDRIIIEEAPGRGWA